MFKNNKNRLNTDQLYDALNYVDHSRANRMKYAHMVIDNPKLIPKLLEILFMVDDKISCRAAWVLEFMCGEKLEEIIPYLDDFTQNIHKIHLDSAVRPVAKICEYLAVAQASRKIDTFRFVLRDTHKEKIIEACFDWMINDEKIATKSYAMKTLFILGKEKKWVHPELAIILERDFQMQSSGFQARARHIMKKIRGRVSD